VYGDLSGLWVGLLYVWGVIEFENAPPPLGDWLWEAACLGVGPQVFFPPSGQRPVEAQQLCGGCAVRLECLDYALQNNQHWGVWGGLTERQRFAVKRARRLGHRHPLDPLEG
jgi:WhiB family redox-sensing transcriptional regulator